MSELFCRELLCVVLSLCCKISNGSNADVFFDYAPHCDSYNVYWYRDGWSYGKEMVWLEQTTEITEANLWATVDKLRVIATELGV